MKVLVTGASGFCGSVACIKLAQAGHEVYANYRNSSRFTDLFIGSENIKHLQADLSKIDIATMDLIFDAIVHTAATSPAPTVTTNAMVRDNVEGTRKLINTAKNRGVKKFIFYSSLSVYGDISDKVVNEYTKIVNPDPYGVTKNLCELMLEETDIPSISLRLPGIIGPKAHRNWQSSLVPKLLSKETINVYNADSPFNNAVHVDTVAEFVTSLLDKEWEDSELLVLGSIGAITVEQMIRRLARGLNIKDPHIRHNMTWVNSFTLDSSRAISKWGYKPMEIGALIDIYAKDCLNETNR